MASSLNLVEFPADDPQRALRFWTELLGLNLEPRTVGEGWETETETETETASPGPTIGLHPRGRGPGDSFSLPYFEVDDLPAALAQVQALGGSVVHPGEVWSICKDSEGSPFGLTAHASAPGG